MVSSYVCVVASWRSLGDIVPADAAAELSDCIASRSSMSVGVDMMSILFCHGSWTGVLFSGAVRSGLSGAFFAFCSRYFVISAAMISGSATISLFIRRVLIVDDEYGFVICL